MDRPLDRPYSWSIRTLHSNCLEQGSNPISMLQATALTKQPPCILQYGTDCRGGDLGGTAPHNLRWGTAHALVPPIFREVVLSDARESMNRVKRGVFLVRKGSNMTSNIANIGNIWEKKGKIWKIWSMKKVIRNFCRENGNFSPLKRHSEISEIGSAEKNVRSPKLGARSPPLTVWILQSYKTVGWFDAACWLTFIHCFHSRFSFYSEAMVYSGYTKCRKPSYLCKEFNLSSHTFNLGYCFISEARRLQVPFGPTMDYNNYNWLHKVNWGLRGLQNELVRGGRVQSVGN